MKKTGKVSAVDFFCIGFGAIVGVGWAVSINSWMAGSGGPLPAALGYILALVMMVPVALCYCELCAMLPVTGGGMAYAFRAFGDNFAFLSGWAAFGAFITIIPWEAIYVVDILSLLFPALKYGEPLYTLAGADIYGGHILVGTALSVILYCINRRGVSASARLQRILCFVLVGSGILAMLFAFGKFSFANLTPVYENVGRGSHSGFLGGTLSILASVPFFIAGFETIPQGIESAGGSIKSVGKTVVLTVVCSCLFYALLLFSLGGAMPWKDFIGYGSPAAALLFRSIYAGPLGQALYLLILIGSICGLLTTWNGFMMASSQILMAMARISIVPDVLARQHPVHKTPVNALKVTLVASLIGPFLGSGLIGDLTTFSAAGYVVSWMLTAFCLIKLRRSEPGLQRPYTIPGGVKTAWFAGLCMAVLLALLLIPGQPVWIGQRAAVLFLCWMSLGGVLYVLDSRQRARYSKLRRASILFAGMNAAGSKPMPEMMEIYDESYQILSFIVPDASVGQSLTQIGWGKNNGLFVLKIERDTEIIMLPAGRTVLQSGDHIFAMGAQR
ncbi:MAG: amino acid permease, partial [Faecousia sp.]